VPGKHLLVSEEYSLVEESWTERNASDLLSLDIIGVTSGDVYARFVAGNLMKLE
jgi:hypothetical protein